MLIVFLKGVRAEPFSIGRELCIATVLINIAFGKQFFTINNFLQKMSNYSICKKKVTNVIVIYFSLMILNAYRLTYSHTKLVMYYTRLTFYSSCNNIINRDMIELKYFSIVFTLTCFHIKTFSY